MKLSACDRLTLRPITGHWYRAVPLKHWKTRLSCVHSLTRGSRFSGATSSKPGNRILYLGENHQLAMYEVGALLGEPESPLSDPRSSWINLSLHVVLDHVADLTEPDQLKLLSTNHQELTGDWLGHPGVPPTHLLGPALYAVPRLEGFLFASSRRKGRNLVIFPDKLGLRSVILFRNELSGKLESLS